MLYIYIYPNPLYTCGEQDAALFSSFRVFKSMVCDADAVPIKSRHSAHSLAAHLMPLLGLPLKGYNFCHCWACATVGLECHCWAMPLLG